MRSLLIASDPAELGAATRSGADALVIDLTLREAAGSDLRGRMLADENDSESGLVALEGHLADGLGDLGLDVTGNSDAVENARSLDDFEHGSRITWRGGCLRCTFCCPATHPAMLLRRITFTGYLAIEIGNSRKTTQRDLRSKPTTAAAYAHGRGDPGERRTG